MTPEEEARASELFDQFSWEDEPRPSCMEGFALLMTFTLFWAGVIFVAMWWWGVLS